MAGQWRYRGRAISAEDVTFIRELIARHPRLSRRKLSVKLCEAWQWRQANGALRDMVCRGLLLMLHRAGAIELPEVRQVSPNPLARREPPPAILVDEAPITDPFQHIVPIEIEPVRRTGSRSNRCGAPATNRCSTASWNIITISATSSRLAST